MAFDKGDVEITLDGKNYTLRSTARAMRSISNVGGGLVGVLQGLAEFRVETALIVIAAGLNKTSPKDIEEINELVFKSGGVAALIEPLILYAQTVMNGGNPPAPESELGVSDEANTDPQSSA